MLDMLFGNICKEMWRKTSINTVYLTGYRLWEVVVCALEAFQIIYKLISDSHRHFYHQGGANDGKKHINNKTGISLAVSIIKQTFH